MSQEQTVIYTAGTMQEAHLLKDVLAEAGIEATVSNELLEGGAGVGAVGRLTDAQVVVGEEDAEEARRIALYFDGVKHKLPDDVTEETNLTEHIDGGVGEGGVWSTVPGPPYSLGNSGVNPMRSFSMRVWSNPGLQLTLRSV